MKVVTANKINRLWRNGVLAKMIAKTKVLNTAEEIEANTSAENVAGALVAKELYNNLAQGRVEFVVLDDNTLGYRLDGADAVPFFRVKTATKSGSIIVATASRNNITFSFPELDKVLGISALSATTDGNNGLLYSGIYPGGGIAIYGNTITVPVYNNTTSRNANVAVSVTVVGT